MKILVFDDSPLHRKSATALLKGHTITIVSTYDEAQEALTAQTDYDKMNRIMKKRFGEPKERSKEYWDAQSKVCKDCTTQPDFEVVLTDLMVPASRNAQGREGMKFVGQEMPLGTVIALRALAAGIKLVAVVTDLNHHNHPASAAFDGFPSITVGDTKVLCTNREATALLDAETFEEVTYDFLQTTEGKKKYPQQKDYSYRGLVEGKAWNKILERLLKQ